jgi:MFS family permease
VTRWFPRLLIVAFAMQFVTYGIRPLLSYQALALGGGATVIGVISASFSALALVAAVPFGRWIDQWGEVIFVIGGTALIGAVAVLLLTPPHLATLVVSSAALGLGHLATLTALQTLIANGAKRDSRFATFTMFTSIGVTVGPAVAGLLIGDVSATRAGGGLAHADRVFLLSAAVAVVACVVAVSLRTAPGTLADRPPAPGTPPAKGTFRRVMATPTMPNAMAASLTVLVAIDLIAAYLPAYGEANGISVRTVGFLLATQGLAALAVRLVMLRLVAALTRRRLLAGGMIVAAAGLCAVPLTDSVPLLFAIMAMVGFSLGLGQPLTLAWVAERAPAEVRGTAIGIRLSGNRLGQTVLPPAIGTLAGAAGLAAAFVSPALLLAVAGTFVLRSSVAGSPSP